MSPESGSVRPNCRMPPSQWTDSMKKVCSSVHRDSVSRGNGGY
eukprot:CAMPEP_0174349352 /NCGR_PEP_ID=MMETSP0811_2-20130205/6073_1 /TAXON_ID=73025 ORGANISM="Eutreptiella gymnastica-like, Strain CCMP1594" /NCGR_SAMPLE_ID=MMETSP0811_2 /ASSEMBLY_ACC=CAM_ASM_000667 /LENGTH=42 /DNA_ID= /DNA_START= /DNA_END= /DNA_ORIENTATION=